MYSSIVNNSSRKKFGFVFGTAMLLFSSIAKTQTTCTPVFLRCEYLDNPLGIDIAQPRLSWQVKDERRGASQTAYQILVATDSSQLLKANADVWNSEKINSDKTNNVLYNGIPLQSRKKYYWRVIVWDKDGKKSISEIA